VRAVDHVKKIKLFYYQMTNRQQSKFAGRCGSKGQNSWNIAKSSHKIRSINKSYKF